MYWGSYMPCRFECRGLMKTLVSCSGFLMLFWTFTICESPVPEPSWVSSDFPVLFPPQWNDIWGKVAHDVLTLGKISLIPLPPPPQTEWYISQGDSHKVSRFITPPPMEGQVRKCMTSSRGWTNLFAIRALSGCTAGSYSQIGKEERTVSRRKQNKTNKKQKKTPAISAMKYSWPNQSEGRGSGNFWCRLYNWWLTSKWFCPFCGEKEIACLNERRTLWLSFLQELIFQNTNEEGHGDSVHAELRSTEILQGCFEVRFTFLEV